MLDVAFNLRTRPALLPDDTFSPQQDINPLTRLPPQAFAHLNGTLLELWLGGRFLECDCRLVAEFVAEWIRDTDLQVTNRERSSKFVELKYIP